MSEQQRAHESTGAQAETLAVNPAATTIVQARGGQAIAIPTPAVIPPERILATILSSSKAADEVAELLDGAGGVMCSHDINTVEGITIMTRLLGAASEKIQDMGSDAEFVIDAWLICAASKVKDDGVIDDFVALTFASGNKTIRSSSFWVRRSLGWILSHLAGKPWQPIKVRLQRRSLAKGSMLSLGFLGCVNPQQENGAANVQTRKKK